MYVTKTGNAKLGKKNVYVINRPVGLTCPSTCPFLQENSPVRCYADCTENRFKQAREVAKNNLSVTGEQLFSILEEASQRDKVVRIHERGDFNLRGKLDTQYIGQWTAAIKRAIREKLMPKTWFYTHIYSKILAKLGNLNNVAAYASVHSSEDLRKAKRAGFNLFAYVIKVKKKKGGSQDFPAYVDVPELGRTLVCPEQRLGRDKITCEKCKYCIEGRGNVVFLEMHGKGA